MVAPKCGHCYKAVAITHRHLPCGICQKIFHIKCGNIKPKDYEQYKIQTPSINWTCQSCKLINTGINETVEPNQLAFKDLVNDIKKYRGLSIAHININGIYTKRNQIKLLLEETDIDILAVSETHLHSGIDDGEITVEGYELLRRDRVSDTGWGGVLIYHKTPLNGIEFDINVNDLEMLWIECTVKSQKILVSCLYQPPRNKKTFLAKFDQIMDVVNQKRTNFAILGDFNIDLISDNNSVYQFNILLKKHRLCNIVKEPTRITENSTTLIDHIIIPKHCDSKIKNTHAIDLGLSDHHIIYCTIDILKKRSKPIYQTIKNYKNVDVKQLKHDIRSAPWHICDIFDDVDDIVSTWEELYKSVVNAHVKERKVKLRANSHPWMNSAIRKQLNNRYKLLKLAQKTAKGSHEWKLYKRARNYCTNLLRVAEANHWKEKFKNLNSSSKEFWNCINEFTGKSKSNQIGPLEDPAGQITNDNQVKSETLNDFFANIGKLDKDPNNAKLQSHIYRITPTINEIAYSREDLSSAFKQVFKPSKAGGHDGISSKVVRMIGEDILDGIHYIAKGSFSSLKFPTSYKTSKVSCIFKKGSKVKSENYRPISLLCLPGKVLESVFSSRIDSHISHHQLLSKHQWGFRKGRSPELMLLRLTEKLSHHLSEGKYVGMIFIDFSKAFDSVCHTTLLKKLQAIGISGDSFEWCSSYLKDRQQFTIVNGSKSGLASVDQGVPQGSLLGPRLYSCHANDLPDTAEDTVDQDQDDEDQVEMFADDTNGITIASNYDILIAQIQDLCNRLQKWAKLNGMIIHPGKTKIIVLSRRQFIGPTTSVTLENRHIEIVENHKVLGTTIDNKLSWKAHTDKVITKFNVKVKQLKRMQTLSSKVLENFYFRTVIPSVTYNISIWGSCHKSYIDALDEIHAKAAKVIHRLPYQLSTFDTFEKVKWMSISYLYKRRLLCLMHKVYYKTIDPEIVSMFKYANPCRRLRRKNQLAVSVDHGNKNCFSYKGVRIWNCMPNELTGIESHLLFKQTLSEYKEQINSYSFEYNTFNIHRDFIFL